MKISLSIHKHFLFVLIFLLTVCSLKANAQNEATNNPVDCINLGELVKLKNAYDRCTSAEDLDKLLIQATLSKPHILADETGNGIDLLFSKATNENNTIKSLRFPVTDRVLIVTGKSKKFHDVIADLIDELQYDDNYAYDRAYNSTEGCSSYIFHAIYKDIRIQIFTQDSLSYLVMD